MLGHFKRKKIKFVFSVAVLLWATVFLAINAYAGGINFVTNPGFEQGDLFWKVINPNGTASEIKLDSSQSHSGNSSYSITNTSPNYAGISQTLNLKKNTQYKLSCWIKTEDVGTEALGACFLVYGTNIASVKGSYVNTLVGAKDFKSLRSITIDKPLMREQILASYSVKGTSAVWDNPYMYIKTGDQSGDVTVTLSLGYEKNLNIGKVWFDDFVVEEVPVTGQNPLLTASSFFMVLFLLLAGLVFYLLQKASPTKKQKSVSSPEDTGKEKLVLFSLLGIGFIIRIIIASQSEGLPFDTLCFKMWSSVASTNLAGFYTSGIFADYPPVYIYVLSVLGKLASLSNLYTLPWAYSIMMKIPSVLADLVTAYLLYTAAGTRFNNKTKSILAALLVFNPVTILNSSMWGQVDSLFTLLIVSALILIGKDKLQYSTVLFAVAVLMKPQGIIFLPVLFYALLKRKSFSCFLQCLLSGLITAVVILLPFSRDPLWIFKLMISTASEYTYASCNAYNFFNLLGANLKEDSSVLFIFSYSTWGYIFITLITLFVGYLYMKGNSSQTLLPVLASFVLISGVFTLSSRMHERYLFPAVILALFAFVYSQDKRVLSLFTCYSLTAYINAAVPLFSIPTIPSALMSLINVVLFAFLAKVSWDLGIGKGLPSNRITGKKSSSGTAKS